MKLIVSDTSPITNLIQIGQLHLLQQLFEQIIIPKKVYQELSNYEHHQVIKKHKWIIVKEVTNKQAVRQLSTYLDLGEAEAIVLAKELQAHLLIIDERKGRKIALEQGLEIIGLLGILVQSKQAGYVHKLKPILDQLIDEIGFRVSKNLYQLVLKSVNEL